MTSLQTVAILGAAGMTGRALARLAPEGVRLVLGTRGAPTIPISTSNQFEIRAGDLSDPHQCRAILDGADAVIMAAAASGGFKQNQANPWVQVVGNTNINLSVIQTCVGMGIKRLVLMNSSTMYQAFTGDILEGQLDRNSPCPGHYAGVGETFRFIERCGLLANDTSGTQVVSLRLANIYGPFARFDPSRSNFLPALIRKAVAREDPFFVYGSPSVSRNVIYVDDAAMATWAALAHPASAGECYNLSGDCVTVGQAVGMILEETTHAPSEVQFGSPGDDAISHRDFSTAKIQSAIGWSPKTGIREGIRKTIGWWEENQEKWAA
jgi:nucleoside-diphosphate-sugar epimerase